MEALRVFFLRGRHRLFKYYLHHFHAPKGFFYAGAQETPRLQIDGDLVIRKVLNFLTDSKYFDYCRLGTPEKRDR
jgi:hypothetical protein